MLSLSPAKLLVILVIALIVLGPEKLPQVARQIGAAWHDMRRWRARVEDEVRGTFPNLPPTHEVAQAVRSPLAFLDRLADEHEKALTEEPGPTADPDGASGSDPPIPAASNGSAPANGSSPSHGSVAPGGSGGGVAGPDDPAPRRIPAGPGAFPTVPDDPSMN